MDNEQSSEKPQVYTSRPLGKDDLIPASQLDRASYPPYGISEGELGEIVRANPDWNVGVFDKDGKLAGFAYFVVVEPNKVPIDYAGSVAHTGPALWVQSFTTNRNYQGNPHEGPDAALLAAIEAKARVIAQQRNFRYIRVMEAVPNNPTDHPYSKESRSGHDVYGFYDTHGYKQQVANRPLVWDPNRAQVACKLLAKTVAT